MKFYYNTSFTLPKQSQSSRPILSDGFRFFGCFFGMKKKNHLITEEILYHQDTSYFQDLENQMDIAEKRRLTLLKDFLDF